MAEPEALTVRELLDELNAIVRSFPEALNSRVKCGESGDRVLDVTAAPGSVLMGTNFEHRMLQEEADVEAAVFEALDIVEDVLALRPELDEEAVEDIMKEVKERT